MGCTIKYTMVYFKCENKVRAGVGKLRFNEGLRREQRKFRNIDAFQASLPGIFFENWESARHERKGGSKVPGLKAKYEDKKEANDA